jgi:predicted lipoprotein with Yx(FWY)xxD motif
MYTYSLERTGRSACQSACAVKFPPLLTSGQPQGAPGSGLVQGKVGMIVRADGTRQVTYNGKPLYLDGDEKLDITNPSTPFSGSGDGMKPPIRSAGTFSLVSAP